MRLEKPGRPTWNSPSCRFWWRYLLIFNIYQLPVVLTLNLLPGFSQFLTRERRNEQNYPQCTDFFICTSSYEQRARYRKRTKGKIKIKVSPTLLKLLSLNKLPVLAKWIWPLTFFEFWLPFVVYCSKLFYMWIKTPSKFWIVTFENSNNIQFSTCIIGAGEEKLNCFRFS